ncbi:hypothetical protein ACFQGE_05060 [Halomicroarcula sp. GCM10025817]|uniref:hypothetical protein n=1 Tax=Haloarcula TaxID=2237 RepID=UPI0023E8C65B|nr:hypothetical protein [Halomicroarcula sp. SYNS111]
MATHIRRTLGQSSTEGPDSLYVLVAGLYVAAFLAPALVLGLSRAVTDAAVLYVGFLVAVASVTVVASGIVSRTPGLAVSLGRYDAVWLLAVLPFCWFGGVFGAVAVGLEPPNFAVPLAVIGTAGGMLLGIMLVAMSRTRYANAALADAVDFAEWEARWPRRWRRVAGGISLVAFTVSTLGIISAFVFNSEWGWWLYNLLFVGVVLMNVLNPRTFRVTDAGLVIEHPLQRQFRPWPTYTSYELTDEALVLHPVEWWRPAHRCDRADIDDVDAAVTALDDCLAQQ